MFENLIKTCGSTTAEFRPFRFVDKNPLSGTGKTRILYAPNSEMRRIHRLIITCLTLIIGKLPFATACQQGDSPRKNVEKHRLNTHFYLTDLKNAFKNVDGHRLASIIAETDGLTGKENVDTIFEFLERFCLTQEGGLIIGAPASPILFNLYADRLLDRPIGELCLKWDVIYSRYLDDLTFSAPVDNPIGDKKRRAIREIIEKARFDVNHWKSQVRDLRKGAIFINGVGLELGGRIFCPRKYCRKIKGAAHLRGKVPKSKIMGMMGVFHNLTDGRVMNRTEQKLMNFVS